MRVMRFRACTGLMAAVALIGCARTASAPSRSLAPQSKPQDSWMQPVIVAPSRVLPDIPPETKPVGYGRDGSRLYLLHQMRVVERPSGALERAAGLLPAGRSKVDAVALPARLGGGYLFYASSPSQTQLWHAADWLAPLQPVARVPHSLHELIVGFDRLYLRSRSSLLALDLASGKLVGLGPLPVPFDLGPMHFADAWRAVVVSDVRGAMATFDAGASWRPLGINQPVRAITSRDGHFLIRGDEDSFVLAPDGTLTIARHASMKREEPGRASHVGTSRFALRRAIERGVPLDARRVLVATEGRLEVVDVGQGTVLQTIERAYPSSYAECIGMRVGRGPGFACGQLRGPTTVFEASDGAMRPVLQWPEPRMVIPSGNGAVVVRAPCPGTKPVEGTAQYCVRGVSGALRDVQLRGDLGAERIAGLSDGSVAVLIAPRPGADGRLVLLRGGQAWTISLNFGDMPQAMRAAIHRGTWLRGVQEVKPGVLGVWVEQAGQVQGLQMGLDGRVTAGQPQRSPATTLVSGRYALTWNESGEAMDTVDGGLTWEPVLLPARVTKRERPQMRGCSAVGCISEGWLRVGWGKARDQGDLKPEEPPSTASAPGFDYKAMRLTCVFTGRSSPAPKPLPAPASHEPKDLHVMRRTRTGWGPFGALEAPNLASSHTGYSTGIEYAQFRYRVYAWGPKLGDWSRHGSWVVRFDYPYDPLSLPISSAVSSSPPWPDATAAARSVGSLSVTVFDPASQTAVLGWCSAPRQCSLYGVMAGQPPLPFYTSEPDGLPTIESMVRTESGWTMLARRHGEYSQLWQVDVAGHATKVRDLPRVRMSLQPDMKLVRRARSPGVGLWLGAAEGHRDWLVLPIDSRTAQVLDAVSLGPRDLGGRLPPRCEPDQDGWVIETQFPVPPRLRLEAAGPVGNDTRALLRVDGSKVCVQALSTRVATGELDGQPRGAAPATAVTTVALEDVLQKHELLCWQPDAS